MGGTDTVAWVLLMLVFLCAMARMVRARMLYAHRSALGDEESAALLSRGRDW